MRQRFRRSLLVRWLLAVALLSSGASAPFAHVHPPEHDHGAGPADAAAGGAGDAGAGWFGVHWHAGGRGQSGTGGPGIGERVSVAQAMALDLPPAGAGALPALTAAPHARVLVEPAGRAVPAPASAAHDPPPRGPCPARAPPARS